VKDSQRVLGLLIGIGDRERSKPKHRWQQVILRLLSKLQEATLTCIKLFIPFEFTLIGFSNSIGVSRNDRRSPTGCVRNKCTSRKKGIVGSTATPSNIKQLSTIFDTSNDNPKFQDEGHSTSFGPRSLCLRSVLGIVVVSTCLDLANRPTELCTAERLLPIWCLPVQWRLVHR
jgi:hypothetical protein